MSSPIFQFQEKENSLELVIKRRPGWATAALFGVWLLGIAFFNIVTFYSFILNPSKAGIFMVVILLFDLAGIYFLQIFLWNVRGREVISLSPTGFTFIQLGSIFFKLHKYDLHKIDSFFLTSRREPFLDISNLYGKGLFGGEISFKYGRRKIRFGQKLSRQEAVHVVRKLNSYLEVFRHN